MVTVNNYNCAHRENTQSVETSEGFCTITFNTVRCTEVWSHVAAFFSSPCELKSFQETDPIGSCHRSAWKSCPSPAHVFGMNLFALTWGFLRSGFPELDEACRSVWFKTLIFARHFSSGGEGEGLNLRPVFCSANVWSQPSSGSKHGGEVIL